MRQLVLRSLFLSALLASLSPLWARPLTVEDLVSFARVSHPVASADGQSVAFSVRETDLNANRGRMSIWSIDLGTPSAEPKRLTVKEQNAQDPQFSPDGKSLYFLATQGESTQIHRFDISTKDGYQRGSLPVSDFPVDVDAYWVSPDGKHILISVASFADCETLACNAARLKQVEQRPGKGQLYTQLFIRHWDQYTDGRRAQLFLASLDQNGRISKEPTRLTHVDGDIPSKPFGDAAEVQFAPDGKSVFFTARIAGRSEPWSTNFDIYSINIDGSNLKNWTESNLAWDSDPLLSKDGKTLYYRAMAVPGAEADRFRIRAIDLASGQQRDVAASFDRSVGSLQWSKDGKTLLTTVDDHGNHILVSINPKTGAVKSLTEHGHVGEFTVTSNSIIVAQDSLTHPADLYSLDGRGVLKSLTHFNERQLADIEFATPTVFTFKGFNNETVQGTVFKPVGYQPNHRYPVAFLIHGGPQGSWLDSFSYRWNPETYAGLGYAVVTIDFHGSTGYGQAFTDSISEHWGDRPLEDLQKGWATALQEFPFLDGSNACALGASYGGFMISWIAGHWHTPESGAWRCLVNHDGVLDARAMYYTTEELWFAEHENGGTPWSNPAAYERFNPITAVGEWRVPTLVIQGARDYRVPIGQGIGAFTALQRRGIESELLLFPNESHWVLSPQNSIQWHHTVEDWLKRHLQK